jgi:hypothetical protein
VYALRLQDMISKKAGVDERERRVQHNSLVTVRKKRKLFRNTLEGTEDTSSAYRVQ